VLGESFLEFERISLGVRDGPALRVRAAEYEYLFGAGATLARSGAQAAGPDRDEGPGCALAVERELVAARTRAPAEDRIGFVDARLVDRERVLESVTSEPEPELARA
jgi:hypothetical protein